LARLQIGAGTEERPALSRAYQSELPADVRQYWDVPRLGASNRSVDCRFAGSRRLWWQGEEIRAGAAANLPMRQVPPGPVGARFSPNRSEISGVVVRCGRRPVSRINWPFLQVQRSNGAGPSGW